MDAATVAGIIMRTDRGTTAIVIVFFLLSVYLCGQVLSKIGTWQCLFDDPVNHKPRITLLEQSRHFEGLVECINHYVGASCFARYRGGILEDYQSLLAPDKTSTHQLEKCFWWVSEERKAPLIILKTAECIYTVTNESKYTVMPDNRSTRWMRGIAVFGALVFLAACFHILMVSETQTKRSETTEKKVTIEHDGIRYDLSTPEGLSRWRARFQTKVHSNTEKDKVRRQTTELNSNIDSDDKEFDSVSTRVTLGRFGGRSGAIEEELVAVENEKLGAAMTRRARTDVNIHDPSKPIPSALDHPTVDKYGNPLKRVFLPGRGWVSTKTLQLERNILLQSVTSV